MKEGSGLIRHTPPLVTSQLAISDAIVSGGDSAVKPSVCQVAGTRLGQPPQRAATRACAPRTPRAEQRQGRRRTMTHIGRHCGGQSVDMCRCARPRRLAIFSTQSRVRSAVACHLNYNSPSRPSGTNQDTAAEFLRRFHQRVQVRC